MVVFMLLLQSAVAYPAPSMQMNHTRHETDLINRIRGTVFQNDVLRSTPGLLTAHQCVDQMHLIFKELPEGPTSGTLPWRTVSREHASENKKKVCSPFNGSGRTRLATAELVQRWGLGPCQPRRGHRRGPTWGCKEQRATVGEDWTTCYAQDWDERAT